MGTNTKKPVCTDISHLCGNVCIPIAHRCISKLGKNDTELMHNIIKIIFKSQGLTEDEAKNLKAKEIRSRYTGFIKNVKKIYKEYRGNGPIPILDLIKELDSRNIIPMTNVTNVEHMALILQLANELDNKYIRRGRLKLDPMDVAIQRIDEATEILNLDNENDEEKLREKQSILLSNFFHDEDVWAEKYAKAREKTPKTFYKNHKLKNYQSKNPDEVIRIQRIRDIANNLNIPNVQGRNNNLRVMVEIDKYLTFKQNDLEFINAIDNINSQEAIEYLADNFYSENILGSHIDDDIKTGAIFIAFALLNKIGSNDSLDINLEFLMEGDFISNLYTNDAGTTVYLEDINIDRDRRTQRKSLFNQTAPKDINGNTTTINPFSKSTSTDNTPGIKDILLNDNNAHLRELLTKISDKQRVERERRRRQDYRNKTHIFSAFNIVDQTDPLLSESNLHFREKDVRARRINGTSGALEYLDGLAAIPPYTIDESEQSEQSEPIVQLSDSVEQIRRDLNAGVSPKTVFGRTFIDTLYNNGLPRWQAAELSYALYEAYMGHEVLYLDRLGSKAFPTIDVIVKREVPKASIDLVSVKYGLQGGMDSTIVPMLNVFSPYDNTSVLPQPIEIHSDTTKTNYMSNDVPYTLSLTKPYINWKQPDITEEAKLKALTDEFDLFSNNINVQSHENTKAITDKLITAIVTNNTKDLDEFFETYSFDDLLKQDSYDGPHIRNEYIRSYLRNEKDYSVDTDSPDNLQYLYGYIRQQENLSPDDSISPDLKASYGITTITGPNGEEILDQWNPYQNLHIIISQILAGVYAQNIVNEFLEAHDDITLNIANPFISLDNVSRHSKLKFSPNKHMGTKGGVSSDTLYKKNANPNILKINILG